MLHLPLSPLLKYAYSIFRILKKGLLKLSNFPSENTKKEQDSIQSDLLPVWQNFRGDRDHCKEHFFLYKEVWSQSTYWNINTGCLTQCWMCISVHNCNKNENILNRLSLLSMKGENFPLVVGNGYDLCPNNTYLVML